MAIIERKRIKIKDSAKRNIRDNFGANSDIIIPKRNRVLVESRDIRTGEKRVEQDTHNLIVYHGRSWLMQRAFNLNLGAVGDGDNPKPWANNASSSVSELQRTGWKDMFISWFALGIGGAEEADPLEPKTALSVEYELINHIPIGADTTGGENPTGIDGNLRYTHPEDSTSFGVFQRAERTRDYHKIDDLYPSFLTDQDVIPGLGGTEDPNYYDMEVAGTEDPTTPIVFNGYKADSYLRALVRVTVAPEEYNGPDYYSGSGENTYRDISEAGLYVSPYYTPAEFTGVYNEVELFAKVNFSSVRKDETRELIFSWYIYF